MGKMGQHNTMTNVSRRNFLRLAVGSLVALPTVAGGYAVPAVYADSLKAGEKDGGNALDDITKITMVSASQVGFVVVDTANGGRTKVSGAHVTVTSRFNNKSVDGYTNNDGEVILDVRKLAENPAYEDVDELESYAFNGSIKVTCKGYREFETALVRINGGGGLMVPVRSLTENKPFPRMVSFNEWDILYTKNAFASTPQNDGEHEVVMEFMQLENRETTVYFKHTETDTILFSVSGMPKDGVLKLTAKGKFLQRYYKEAFPIVIQKYDVQAEEVLDPSFSFFNIEAVQGSNHYSWPINLLVCETDIENNMEEYGASLTPFNTTGGSKTGLDLKWPSGLPVVGGGSIKPFMPDLLVNLSINPWGYLQFTAKTPTFGYVRDNGEHKGPQDWKWQPRKSAYEQFEKGFNAINKGADKAAKAFSDGKGIIRPIDTFWSFKATGNAQIVALATWDIVKHLYRGMIAGQIFICVDANATWNFWAGPVPFIATLAFNMTSVLSLQGAMYTQESADKKPSDVLGHPDEWHFDYSNTGLTLTFNFTPSFSFGVGVKGIGSVSAKASFTLTLVFGLTVRKDLAGHSGMPLPHMIFGYSIQIAVVFSFFLFTTTIPIHNWKYRDFYNNWKGGLQPMDDDPMNALEDMSMEELLDGMNIITDAMLEGTVEDFGLTNQAEDYEDEEPFDWESMREPNIQAMLDDGRVISYAVYRMTPVDDLPEAQGDGTEAEAIRASAEGIEGAEGTNGEAGEVAGDVAAQEEKDAGTAAAVEESVEQTDSEVKDAAAGNATPAKKKGVLRRRPSAVVYESDKADLSALSEGNTLLMEPSANKLGANGGVRPESDKIITRGQKPVFGDPRVKIVDLHSDTEGLHMRATCAFRIGSVSIDGQMRTRVIMTVIDADTNMPGMEDMAGYSKPLDFQITDVDGITHADLYDYDFDIAFTTSGNSDTVHLVVVSGRRADGDSTTLAQVATDLVFSYINFHVYEAFGGRTAYLVRSISAASIADDEYPYHSITNVVCATNGTPDSNTLMVAYLDVMSESQEDILVGDYGFMKTRISFVLINQSKGTWQVPDIDERQKTDEAFEAIDVATLHRMTISPKVSGAYTLSLTSASESYFFVLRLDEEESVFTSIKEAAMLEDQIRLLPWPGQDCFLTNYPTEEYLAEMNETDLWKHPDEWDRSKWVLQRAEWVEDNGTPVLKCTPIGPEGFNIDNYGINNAGSFIFWPQTREPVEKRIYDDDDTYETVNEGSLYQLMACRIHNGYFSEPFVAADLSHDLSSISIVASRDTLAPLEVLSTEPVDTGDVDADGNPVCSACNVWYTAIPHLRVITAIGCLAPVPFVSPGGKLLFHVAVRNDGNSYLSGCTAQLCVHEVSKDEDGNITSENARRVKGCVAQMTFSKSTLVESHYNPVVDGEFQNVEPDFALAPGKSAIYKVFVTVPKDWEGEKYVSFLAEDPIVAEGGGFTSSADEDVVYQTFTLEPGEYRPLKNSSTSITDRNRQYMATIDIGEAVAGGDPVADAPLEYWTTSGEGNSSESSASSGTITGSGTNGSHNANNTGGTSTGGGTTTVVSGGQTSLPGTSDLLSAGIAAGIATAGAALAAYGKRRAANAAADDDEEE